jgi:hypothetical protein
MAYLVGTDEAGYAPNLGPLVISATVWEVPDDVAADALYDRLSHVITSERPTRKQSTASPPRIVMGDSKKLYASDAGLRHLEHGVWAALHVLDRRPRTWRDVWQALDPQAVDAMRAIPWYCDHDRPAPLQCDPAEIEPSAETLQAGLAAAGVRLVAVRSRAVFAHQFNDLVDRHGSKGTLLSKQTMTLAAEMMAPLPDAPISLICDKHGGRDFYRDLLEDHFPDRLIEVHSEGRRQSLYRFGPPHRRVDVRFCAKAEGFLPVALASMASKYLRELAMQAFNTFWDRHVPGLRPTAGYPVDAGRFRSEIAPMQRQLDIDDRLLWRSK